MGETGNPPLHHGGDYIIYLLLVGMSRSDGVLANQALMITIACLDYIDLLKQETEKHIFVNCACGKL
jgi:hypothetical protein